MLHDDEVDNVLEALDAHFGDRLSPWEVDFLASVGDQWEQRRSLSDKQRAVVERIWERFARG